MKRFIVGVAIVALVLAGLPPVLGMVYEQQVTEGFQRAPQHPMVATDLVDYQRGLYQSTGTVRLAFTEEYLAGLRAQALAEAQARQQGAPETPQAAQQMLDFLSGDVRFNFEVNHGPFTLEGEPAVGLAFFRSTLTPESGPLAELQHGMGLPHLVWAEGVVGFDGVTTFTGGVPEMASDDGEASFAFTGVAMNGTYDARTGVLDMTASSDGLSFVSPVFLVEMNSLAMMADVQLVDELLWTGDSRLDLGSMIMGPATGDQDEGFALRDVGVTASATTNDAGDRMDMTLEYSMGRVVAGPDNELTDLALGLHFSNIDVGTYRQLAREAQAINSDAATRNDADLQALAPLFVEMLRSSPRLEMAPFRFTSNGEAFEADFDFAFHAARVDEGLFDQLAQNPALLIAGLTARGRMTTPESLMTRWVAEVLENQLAQSLPPDAEVTEEQLSQAAAAQAAITIEGLVAQGMIERKGPFLESDFDYADGLLTVRGNAIPLGRP